jgi:hypothetical protein
MNNKKNEDDVWDNQMYPRVFQNENENPGYFTAANSYRYFNKEYRPGGR